MTFNPSLEPQSFNLYDSSFNDLDNLFEGFFDLSMPTIWQDPLFDGDAFSSADLDAAMGGMDQGVSIAMQDEEGYDVVENGLDGGGMGGKMDTGQGGGYPEIGMH